ncbi:glycosyltransferase [Prevotella sp. KH2C16]|uniref:glycosyltransferase n=1 Tax=Prevotella sp. KH2C16 TaxID=1855325 RepID=UPI0008E7EA8C|nr:glycosyltransferase [Prevotella sp. KH2C16]SFF86021.1 Glycosyltransferase involved in cell wall bisynthesis [Prevotella sp. KH2C16]
MKIIHISTDDFNGAGLCAYRICKAQRELGLDSQLIVRRRKHTDDFVHSYGNYTYFTHSILHKARKLLHIKDDRNICRKLTKLYNAVYTLPTSPIDLSRHPLVQQADIIHIHWVGEFLDYRTFFDALREKPMIFTMHDENLLYGITNLEQQRLSQHPLEQKYYQLKLEKIRLLQQMGVVFLSKMGFRQYGEHEMIAHARKTLIYNMVDYRLFQPKNKAEARARLDIAPETKIFAFCACNINEPRKGLNELSLVLGRISPEYRILAIGKNRSRSSWDNVIEIGRMDNPEQLSWLLSAADYFCLPSFKENFAQTPIEAMACGLPVVAFPCSGMEELITPFNGIRCSDFTPEALEEGIRTALATSYDAKVIRQDVIERFSPEKIGKDYLRFYQEVTGS